MKQLMRLLFVSLLAGLWLSLKEAQCTNISKGGYTMSFCHNTSSENTCFTTLPADSSPPVPQSYKRASGWCNPSVEGSFLIIINYCSTEIQRTVKIFLGRKFLANETIIMDAQSLSAKTGLAWVNGYATVSTDVKIEPFHGRACAESEQGRSLAYCVVDVKSQYRYICEYSGVGNVYNHVDAVQTEESSDKHCICISPQCSMTKNLGGVEFDRKWWSCNCNQSYDIVCQKEEEKSDAVTTKIASTKEMSQSTPADITSSPSLPGTTTSRLQRITGDIVSTSSMTQKPPNRASNAKTTAFTSLSSAAAAAPAPAEPSRGLSNRYATLLILLLLVAVIFIIVAVILIIRKRKYASRYETSPLNRTDPNEAVPRGYEIMVRDNRPSGDNIYTELEVTLQPTPSSNTTYASIQPTSEVVDMGKSVDYVDIDFPKKDQQKAKSADKGTVSVFDGPIYSQPFESPSSDSNTDYVEPYKPDKAPTATAPVQSHNAAGDQQNVYSLAKAIPSGDPSVIYSEPNKPSKSSATTGKEVKATDPVYLNVIEVKPGAESEGVATQDPSAVYAEPIKLEKSS